jgi:predicted nucleic acid-binding protein
VTDAHVLGIALKHGARLVTLDRNLANLVPSTFDKEKAVVTLTALAT